MGYLTSSSTFTSERNRTHVIHPSTRVITSGLLDSGGQPLAHPQQADFHLGRHWFHFERSRIPQRLRKGVCRCLDDLFATQSRFCGAPWSSPTSNNNNHRFAIVLYSLLCNGCPPIQFPGGVPGFHNFGHKLDLAREVILTGVSDMPLFCNHAPDLVRGVVVLLLELGMSP